MDFIDSATGTGGRHQETEKGATETEEGISRMKHGSNYNGLACITGTTTTGAFSGPTQAGTTNPQITTGQK